METVISILQILFYISVIVCNIKTIIAKRKEE